MTTLFYTKGSRVSRVRAITDTDTGEEKRTGEVPTLWNRNGGLSWRITVANLYSDVAKFCKSPESA